jgi:predicted metal-dependent peptidase
MLMIGKEIAPRDRVLKAVAAVMGNTDYDGINGLLMIGDHTVLSAGNKKGVRTAATNGKHTWYLDDFVATLNDAELRFLVLHEVFHILLKHITTYDYLHKLDADRCNRACDYVINGMLIDYDAGKGFITMPSMGLYDAKYKGMDADAVFKLLPSSDENGQGQGQGSMDDHDWDGAEEMSDAEKAELEQAIDQALRQGALLAGKNGSGGARLIEDLLASKVDYKAALREWVCDTCAGNDYSTWTKPNRRYLGYNMVMPSGVSDVVGELVIANDMSGSIGAREIAQILARWQTLLTLLIRLAFVYCIGTRLCVVMSTTSKVTIRICCSLLNLWVVVALTCAVCLTICGTRL